MAGTVVTIASVAVALAGSAALVLTFELQEPGSYRGELTSTTAITRVLLPANAPLGETLVREGDPVRRGETLAVLDEGALTDEIAAVDLQIASGQALRRCILDPSARAFDAAGSSGSGHTDLSVAEIAEVRLRCEAIRNEARAELVKLEAAAAQVRSGRAVIEARLGEARPAQPEAGVASSGLRPLPLAILRQRGHKTPVPIDSLEEDRALAYALALYEIDGQLRDIEAGLVSARVASARRLIEESTTLRATLDDLGVVRRELEGLRVTPRIVAPVSGIVHRLRSVAPGSRFQTAGVFMEIAEEAAPVVTVVFRVPADDATRIARDDVVAVRLAGLMQDEVHHGRIIRTSLPVNTAASVNADRSGNARGAPETFHLAEASVDLDPMSRSADATATLLAPTAGGATAHVDVTLARATLAGRFVDAISESGLFSGFPMNGIRPLAGQ